MANYSFVMANFRLIKEGASLYPPKEVVKLILETSSDEGWQNDDMSFSLAGRWTYDNNLVYKEMQDILSWLRQHDYEGMTIHYAEYEQGEGYASVGRATYKLLDNPQRTDLTIETNTWMFEEFCETFLNSSYPDLDDYEDEDGDTDFDEYTIDCDNKIEEILTYLDKEMLEKGNVSYVDLEHKSFPI